MKLPIAARIRQAGLPGHFVIEQELAPQPYMGAAVAFAAPLHIEGSCVWDGTGFNVTGTAKTALCSTCALCAQAFDEPFGFDFEERFVKDPGPEDDAYPVGSEELDLTQPVLDNLFLNLPFQSKCREDCKGLCPVCGCDLNIARCACRREEEPERVNPFAKLSALLNHDKEV